MEKVNQFIIEHPIQANLIGFGSAVFLGISLRAIGMALGVM